MYNVINAIGPVPVLLMLMPTKTRPTPEVINQMDSSDEGL
jgi:hypothetical protein